MPRWERGTFFLRALRFATVNASPGVSVLLGGMANIFGGMDDEGGVGEI
jgi:hypothetical protein